MGGEAPLGHQVSLPLSLSSKNIKIQDQIRSKIIERNTCIMEFQTIDRQLKF